MLWMYQRVFFGKVTGQKNMSLPDLDSRERAALWPAALMALAMGVVPLIWINAINTSVSAVLGNAAQLARVIR